MNNEQIWSWIVTIVGVTGFFLAGRKIWWAWYVNIGCQVLWVIFAFVTGFYAFLAGVACYSVVFVKNAYTWTKEHREKQKPPPQPIADIIEATLDEHGLTVIAQFKPEHKTEGMRLLNQGEFTPVSLGPLGWKTRVYPPGTLPQPDPKYKSDHPHICHPGPSPMGMHAIRCPTGAHPNGWQHMPGVHKMCTECG